MKKRFLPLFLILCIVLPLLLLHAGAEEGDIPAASTTYTEISYSYTPGGLQKNNSYSSAFPYADVMLLGDANTFSGDIAKASVALASVAYDRNQVNSTLGLMGYTCSDNSAVYARANNLSIWDNDYVAYTIASKDVAYNGETYRIYCVPVKGTGANAEWFSNFNLGTGAEHEGFRIAAQEVYDDLTARFASDGYDQDHRILWLTGHSRGAAVSNLVAGWLSERGTAKAEHVFGYTFACPANSKNADTSMQNIYNFNLPGDMIPLLPVDDWGYHRYGVSVESIDDTVMGDIAYQFKRICGETLDLRMRSTWRSLIHTLAPTQKDYYDEQPLFTLVAWALGGKSQASMTDLLVYLGYTNSDKIVEKLAGVTGIPGLKTALTAVKSAFDPQTQSGEQMIADTEGMTAEEVAQYLYDHADTVNKLAEAAGVDIVDLESLKTAYQVVRRASIAAKDIGDIIASGDDLFFDENGNIGTAVSHGHTQLSYTVWMNAAYYGYYGWYNFSSPYSVTVSDTAIVGNYCFRSSSGLTSAVITDGVQIIGSNAFSGCSNMKEAVIPTSIESLGQSAFESCTGLKRITLPIDLETGYSEMLDSGYRSNSSAFTGCSNITEIHYRVGKTGIQPDRIDYGNGFHYKVTLEYISRDSLTTIIYDEGITRIGNRSVYESVPNITSLTLPSTLESIGTAAFEGLKNLTSIEIPEGVTKLENMCFYKCTSLETVVIPKSLSEIPAQCFYYCTSLDNLVIPETVKRIGFAAFSSCTGLTTLVLLEGLESVGQDAFWSCTNIEKLVIPNSLKETGTSAFSGCTGLKSIELPIDYNYQTGNDIFSGCSSVTEIHYRVGTTSAQPDRGDGIKCTNTLEYISRDSLTTIIYDEGITRIGNRSVYESVPNITSLTLPSTLESIGTAAFQGLTQLTTLSVPVSLKTVGSSAFSKSTALTDIYYSGSESDWDSISIASGNDPLLKAKLHVFVPFEIVTQPVDYRGAVNSTASFFVEATGEGLTYQWQLSDNGGKKWTNSSVKTAVYSSKLTAARDGRMLRCIVTDQNGETIISDVVSMGVYGFRITAQPKPYFGAVNSMASFTVEAEGEGLTYQWQISDNGGKKWSNSSVKEAVYSSKLSASRDGRLVRCVVRDAFGNSATSDPASMKLYKLAITQQPVDYVGKVNTYASFTVVAQGDGLTYQWQLSDNNGKKWTDSSATTAVYTSKLSASRDGRLLRCIVTDAYGTKVTSDVVSMNIG